VQNLVVVQLGASVSSHLAWGSGCGKEFRPGWERESRRTGWGCQTSGSCSPGTMSCCALAMHCSYVVCSGWLRKSPPEKKLRLCECGQVVALSLAWGPAEAGTGGPRVAGRGQGGVFSVGPPSP
jgi:hypothetical protein